MATSLVLLALIAGTLLPGPWARAAEQVVRLTITPLDGDTVLYRGVRTVGEEGGRVTLTTVYSRPDGTPIQRTEAVYEAATLVPISYRLEDERSGEQETLARSGGEVRLGYRATGAGAAKVSALAWAPGQAMSATVEPFIVAQWARLIAGEQVPFVLLVPSRRDTYQFRLSRDAQHPMARPGHVVVRMEPGTWLVRRLVDPLFFLMEEEAPHRLMEFRGRSSIKTDAGKDQDLRVLIEYGGKG